MMFVDPLIAEFVVPVLIFDTGIKLVFAAEQRLADVEAQLRLAQHLPDCAISARADDVDESGEFALHRAE